MAWMTENIHQHVAYHFGSNAFQLVQDNERTSRKLGDYRNHLHFNLTHRQHRIILRSLCLGSSVKGHEATRILQRAQNQHLNERERQVNFTSDALATKTD